MSKEKRKQKILSHLHFLSANRKTMMLNNSDYKFLSHINSRTKLEVKPEEIIELVSEGFAEKREEWVTKSLKIERVYVSKKGLEVLSDEILSAVDNVLKEEKRKKDFYKRRGDVEHYLYERNSGFYVGTKLRRHGSKEICLKCRAINIPCSHEHEFKKVLSIKARPPRKTAHKNKWKEFLQEFAPEGLKYLN
jgi:hypothetical protein